MADDTSKLKSSILEYLYEEPKRGTRFPAQLQDERLLSSDAKVLRGFQNIDTTDLLCPLKFRENFEEDLMYPHVVSASLTNFLSSSDFMNQVGDGKIEITSQDLPSFLYKTGTVYDPENETIGLF